MEQIATVSAGCRWAYCRMRAWLKNACLSSPAEQSVECETTANCRGEDERWSLDGGTQLRRKPKLPCIHWERTTRVIPRATARPMMPNHGLNHRCLRSPFMQTVGEGISMKTTEMEANEFNVWRGAR